MISGTGVRCHIVNEVETLNQVNSGHLDRMCVQGVIQRAGGGLAERVLRVLQHLSWLSMSI